MHAFNVNVTLNILTGDVSLMTGQFPSVLQALNDYVVAYHDAVVLFGKMMRDNLLAMKKQSYGESSDIIPFRNMTFDGKS